MGENVRNLTKSFVAKTILISKRLAPILAFAVPFIILYYLYPGSFEITWKGRTYYLFFIWLLFLETLSSWDKFKTSKWQLKSFRTVLFPIVLALPTIYVVAANYLGLNSLSMDYFRNNLGSTISFVEMMPLAIEYLVFTIMLSAIIITEYSVYDLSKYALSTFFLGIIGFIYTIDNLYPYGRFTPFQIIVPTTAHFAANVLNLMGYETTVTVINSSTYGIIPSLKVNGMPSIGIAWPCSGIDSLIIYSVAVLLFLKNSGFSRKQLIGCFIIGAVITYFINVLRIVTILITGLNYGVGSAQWTRFHDYYGPLYSITWIMAYPLIIIALDTLWKKLKNKKRETSQVTEPN